MYYFCQVWWIKSPTQRKGFSRKKVWYIVSWSVVEISVSTDSYIWDTKIPLVLEIFSRLVKIFYSWVFENLIRFEKGFGNLSCENYPLKKFRIFSDFEKNFGKLSFWFCGISFGKLSLQNWVLIEQEFGNYNISSKRKPTWITLLEICKKILFYPT